MKRLTLIVLLAFASVSQAWDFLYVGSSGELLATRSSNPFAVLSRVHRAESLPVQWERNGDQFRFFVEYEGSKWYCEDGTMSVPASELPKIISKLDLLMAIQKIGKIPEFFAWLDSSGLRVFWDAAQNLSTDNPLYEEALHGACEALGLSEEEAMEILEQIYK